MIDLDEALRRWTAGSATPWSATRAKEAADRIAAARGYSIQWEPGDEEWILLADEHAYQGMISIHHPLALLTPAAARTARQVDDALDLIEISDFLDENLRATPRLLKATALPHGWDDDFHPEAFCANDLFVEGV